MFSFGHKFYWILPLFSALMWLSTLLGMFLYWIIDNHVIYPSEEAGQTIAYISDVGAELLKPLFVTGSVITVVFLDLGMIAERWLRHTGRLSPNNSPSQKYLSMVAIFAAIVGAAGLILLSIFDTLRHPKLHDDFLAVFIIGYVVSAIFIVAEYGLLRSRNRDTVILGFSFWLKLVFIIVEIALAIAFGTLHTTGKNYNIAAILEWTIALVFTGYVLSFVVDLYPAARKKYAHAHHTHGMPGRDDEAQNVNTQMRLQDDERFNGSSGGYYANGTTNGNINDSGYRTPPTHF